MAIDADETAYLCEMASRYFKRPVAVADVVWSYSGVRPLLDDESASAASVTRDYELVLDQSSAPVLSVFGGKITTFRKLAEEATDRLQALIGHGGGPGPSAPSCPAANCRATTPKPSPPACARAGPGCRRRWRGGMRGPTAAAPAG
ncbi:hypothetical protein [Chitinimonas koreensis]|uniref:hypothetical protein n=1 Tax=Chitinimonas koreensis TaxID=356302 RepID=UPI0027E53C80|nr:hypothetical protein [Chitinimonas koreensis]